MEKKDLLLEKVQSPEKGGYMQRGNAERTPCSLGGPEGEGSPGVQALSLDGGGKAHPVVAQVIDGVVGPEEDVPKDPQGLAILGGHVGGLDPQHAKAVVVLHNTEGQHSFIRSHSDGALLGPEPQASSTDAETGEPKFLPLRAHRPTEPPEPESGWWGILAWPRAGCKRPPSAGSP